MRLLVWILLALIVFLALRKKWTSNQSKATFTQQPAKSEEGEAMLACAYCQVFFPASEAVFRNEKAYCSAEHADVGR